MTVETCIRIETLMWLAGGVAVAWFAAGFLRAVIIEPMGRRKPMATRKGRK